MESLSIMLPQVGEVEGTTPIVLLGPNGSGKTRLARTIGKDQETVTPISAQRRTWPNDGLPVQEQNQMYQQMRQYQNNWRTHPWQPTDDIDYTLSLLTQEHLRKLNKRNEEGIESGSKVDPVTDSNLYKLKSLWGQLYPTRRLEIGDHFPKVTRLEASESPPYTLKEMSDGERTILYMAARILVAETRFILVDEPELHMHSRLAIDFWNEAERLRPDCRFIYITHDLNFALSRRDATFLVVRGIDHVERMSITDLPTSVAVEVLGAATLPFYARRIIFYEGEPGNGFASEFLSTWFDGPETFAFPCGNREAVYAAVKGLRNVGVVGAEISGLVDRDFYPDSMLNVETEGVTVLDLHEIESILCARQVVDCLALHFRKEPSHIWQEFHREVKKSVSNQLSSIVANRVRERIVTLFKGALSRDLLAKTPQETGRNYSTTIDGMKLPTKVIDLFEEELERVHKAVEADEKEMLRLLPGKLLLSPLATVLGLNHWSALTGLIISSLGQAQLTQAARDDSLEKGLVSALGQFLPPRRAIQ